MSITFLRGKSSSAASIIWIRTRTGGTDESGTLALPAARIPYRAAPFPHARTHPSPRKRRIGESGGKVTVLPEDPGEVHLVEDAAREKRVDERPLQAGEVGEAIKKSAGQKDGPPETRAAPPDSRS